MDAKDLVPHFLSEGILAYFDVTGVDSNEGKQIISLEGKPLGASELKGREIHSKGFYPVVEIQDFPLRKKACFLKVKRRRWTDLKTSEVFGRDWDMVANGMRMTSEFALFLKGLLGKATVEYALSRSLSPTLVADYKTQLQNKRVLKEKWQEILNQLDETD